MGILDGFMTNDPQQQGLLAAAAQILNASGPSLMPHSFGQIAGAGITGFQQGREQAMQQQREQMAAMLQQAQVAQALRQAAALQPIYDKIGRHFSGAQVPPQASAPAVGASDTPSPAPAATSPVAGAMAPQTSAGAPQSAGPQSSGGMFGLSDDALMGGALAGPAELGKAIISANAPTDFTRQLRQAGIDPNSPLGRQIMKANIAKQNYVAPVNARPGSIIRDPFDPSKVVAFNPHIPEGGTPTFDASGNVTGINSLPGAAEVTQQMSRAGAAGKASVEPIQAFEGTQPVFTNKLAAATGGDAPTWTGGKLSDKDVAQLQKNVAAGDAQSKMVLDAYTAAQNKRLTPGLAPGVAESQSALATTGAKRYNDLIQQASDSPTRVNVYDNILNLSREGVQTGPGAEWQNKVKGYIANAPMLGAVSPKNWKDDVSGFQELNKFLYQNAQRNWQAAGGTGTDSQLEAFTKANPNSTMFPQALQKMAEWGKAGELALQAKTNAMQQWKDANNGNVASQDQFERMWRNNFDPVLFQLKTMDPQSAATYVANLKKTNPNAYSALMMKAQALKNIGGL